jgi:hypothetical protein
MYRFSPDSLLPEKTNQKGKESDSEKLSLGTIHRKVAWALGAAEKKARMSAAY